MVPAGILTWCSFNRRHHPGTPTAPIARIASAGGAVTRPAGAKVCSPRWRPGTILFDESIRAIGAPPAAAVGERLSRRAMDVQVLWSPIPRRVAAVGRPHWRSAKTNDAPCRQHRRAALDAKGRREDIARLLSAPR